MSHDRKRGGKRRDKMNQEMRQWTAFRKGMSQPHHSTDQSDVQWFKPGHPNDDNRRHRPDNR